MNIKILNEIEIELYNKMKTSYKQYIGDYINSKSEYSYLQSDITEIRKTITNYFNTLQKLVDDGEWTLLLKKESYGKNIIEYLNNIEKDISKDYFKPLED